MPKCKHLEITIMEVGSWGTKHIREDGQWYHNNFPGDYDDKIWVKCPDCELEKWYNKYRVPKWLKKYLVELNILCEG